MDANGDKPLETPPIDATLAALDAKLDTHYFDPRYRGVYLGRSAVSAAATSAELYGDAPAPDAIPVALDALYPARLAEQVAQFRELYEQRDLLLALQRGLLEVPGGVVRHRGREYHRREIPKLIAEVNREIAEVRRALCEHDRQVRTAHVAAARTLSHASESYLRGLLAILHYADHREADLQDAAGVLQNVLVIALADRRVGSSDRDRLLAAANVAFGVLRDIHCEANLVELGALAGKLEAVSFKAMLEPLKLGAPNEADFGSWLNAFGSRTANATDALAAVSNAALDELLRTEDDVARRVRAVGRDEAEAAPAADAAPAELASAADTPAPPRAPAGYAVLLPGKERPRQTLGWWDRFQIADGPVATTARFLVAAAIIGCVVWVGQFT